MPRLLSLLATRVANSLNFSELSRTLGIPQTTLKRYMSLLELTFLVQMLPPWSSNLGKRLVKTPKINIADTGLAAHLAGLTIDRLRSDPTLAGPLLENFVVMELRRQAGWSRTPAQLFHLRTQTGQEVDVVLENPAGGVVGIEVKATRTISADHFKGLRVLEEVAGPRFVRGIVLYGGREPVAFARNMVALPIDALWGYV
jgi:predicted AAA+ superfamily ATPase